MSDHQSFICKKCGHIQMPHEHQIPQLTDSDIIQLWEQTPNDLVSIIELIRKVRGEK